MAKIYAIANHKGGVGKTTTALNLSASLCLNDKKVLLVDIDPQGNTTKGVGIDKDMVVNSVSDLLLNKKEVIDCMIPTQFDNLYLIPATLELASVDFDLATSDNTKQLRLKQHLDTIKNKFDYIIIDCPPSLGLLNINALIACDGVIIPVQSEYYALDGLILLLSTIRKIQSSFNKKLYIEGILITMYDSRTKLANEVAIEVRKYFKEKVYNIHIPRNIKVAEATSKGKPVVYYDKNSTASKAYLELALEIINNNKKRR